MFSVRIVNVDYYLSTPLQGLDITYSQFRGSQVKQVPVIRIFGSTPGGEKTCLHIHGVFPYLLVPYDGSEDVQKLMYVIATSLDKAINISLGISNSTKQHVFKIVQVSGSPFYGYHEVEHQFLKIFFYNPNMVKRATDLLQNGAICNKVLQPHEAHVPFILQFFIDYNLHGMSFINLKHVLFRRSEDEHPEFCESIDIPLRMSRCELEVDAIATDIHNKLDVTEKIAINPGLTALWEEEKQRRKGDDSFFELVESQPRPNVEPTLSEVLLRNKLRNTLSQQNKLLSMKLSKESVIPYPVETQEGSDILNASALNTHSMVSLYSPKADILDESVINEDIIYSLTSQSDEAGLLNTQDQSLLNVLQNLEDEGDNEIVKQASCNIQYIVEDDSILGSQLFTFVEDEEDLLEACQQIDEAVLRCDAHGESEENLTRDKESCNDNSWRTSNSEDIPQIDGTDDLSDKLKTDIELESCESFSQQCEMIIDDIDCSSLLEASDDNMQSPSMWPVVGIGKEVDCCDEVFSISNESINFVERDGVDAYENLDVKINTESNFDHVLRGDPSFMSQSVNSSFDEASLYTSKENCAWNNPMTSQQLDSSDTIDFLLARLSENNKLEDNRKSEFTPGIECDLTDFTEKSLQFNENLVPLLSLPEDSEDSIYVECTDGTQSVYSDDVLEKTQMIDIFKENLPSKLDSPVKEDIAVLQSNTNEKTHHHDNKASPSRARSRLSQTVKKDNGCKAKKCPKNVEKYKPLRIKFKFPVKGETAKANKKICYINNQVALDITKENVEAYLMKLKNLERFYISNRIGVSSKKIKKGRELRKLAQDKVSLTKDTDLEETKIENGLHTSFDKYKFKKCIVLLHRLQLKNNKPIIMSNTENKRTLQQKKIKTKLENPNSRPFATEIFKPNILTNSSPRMNKNIEKEIECVKKNRQNKPRNTTKEILSNKKLKMQLNPNINDKCSKSVVRKNKHSSVLIDRGMLESEKDKQPKISAISNNSKIKNNIVKEVDIRELVKENRPNKPRLTTKEVLSNKNLKKQRKSINSKNSKDISDKGKLQSEDNKQPNISAISSSKINFNIVEDVGIRQFVKKNRPNKLGNTKKEIMPIKKIKKQQKSAPKVDRYLKSVNKCEYSCVDFNKDMVQSEENKYCLNNNVHNILRSSAEDRINIVENISIDKTQLQDFKNDNQQNINQSKMIFKKVEKHSEHFCETEREHYKNKVDLCGIKNKKILKNNKKRRNPFTENKTELSSEIYPCSQKKERLDYDEHSHKNMNIMTNNNSYSKMIPSFFEEMRSLETNLDSLNNNSKNIKANTKILPNFLIGSDNIREDGGGKSSQTKLLKKKRKKINQYNKKEMKQKIRTRTRHSLDPINTGDKINSHDVPIKRKNCNSTLYKPTNLNTKHIKGSNVRNYLVFNKRKYETRGSKQKDPECNSEVEANAQNNDVKVIQVKKVIQKTKKQNFQQQNKKKTQRNSKIVLDYSIQDKKSNDLDIFKSEKNNQNYLETNHGCVKIESIKHFAKPKELENSIIHKQIKVCESKTPHQTKRKKTKFVSNKRLNRMTEKPKFQDNFENRLHNSDKQIKTLEKQSNDPLNISPLSAIYNTVKSEDPEIGSSNRPTIICSISRSKIKIKLKNTRKPSRIQFLDGTVDSMSSSSDEGIDSEDNNGTRTNLKNQLSSNAETPTKRYKRLDIQIKKSPKAEKSAETVATDFKLNTAVVKLVRNREAELMASRRKRTKLQLSCEDRNQEFKIGHFTDKHTSGPSGISRMNETSCDLKLDLEPNKSPCDESKSVEPSTSAMFTKLNEQTSYNTKSKNIIPPISFSKERKSNLVLESEIDNEVKACSQVQVKSVEDEDFITCDNSCLSLTGRKKTFSNKSLVSKNNSILLKAKQNEGSEPSTSFKNCDKRLLKKYSLPELKVCLTRLPSHFTDVHMETVSNQKKPKETDIVDQIQVSDEHSLTSGVESRLIVDQSKQKKGKTQITSGYKSKVKKMLNFQPEETDLKSDKNEQEDFFQPHISSVKDGDKESCSISGNLLARKVSIRGRKPSIDLFASNSSDTQDSSPMAMSGNSEKEKSIHNDILPGNSCRVNDLCDSSTSTNDFVKLSQSLKSVENFSESDDLNLTTQNIVDDEGILSFYGRTFSEDFVLPDSSMLNELPFLVKQNKSSSLKNKIKTYQPKMNPPSSKEVKENLLQLGFAEVINEEPFYSDPNHVCAASEIGGKTLKVISRSSVDLEEYQGTFNFMSKWLKSKFQEVCGTSQVFKEPISITSVFASDRRVIIAPLKPAPTTNAAKFWLKTKSIISDLKKPKEKPEIKINKVFIPSSPGENSNSDEEIISTTPCTPCTDVSLGSVQGTPQELDIHISSDIRTSTPINIPSRRRSELTKSYLIGRSSIPSLQPVPEENVETSCDGNSKLNYSDSSLEQKHKQVSDASSILVTSQLQKQFNERSTIGSNSHQIDAATPDNTGGFKVALENLQDVHVVSQHQYLTILTMELHVQTRGDLKPDPQYDSITALFYNITSDCVEPELSVHITGAVIIGSEKDNKRSFSSLKCEISYVEDEQNLLQTFVDLVHKWDPDILAGYEIEMFSWGYLLQRGYVLAINLKTQLSRIIKTKPSNSNEDKENELKTFDDNEEELKLTGRIVLNVWRFLRHEVALMSYTFENVMYHILHQRVPLFSFKTLSNWWSHRTHLYRWKTAEHYIVRVEGVVRLLDQLDLVGRTSELARLFGIQFYEVLSRGSQFRVESMMLRLAKPLNYVAVTPSVKQRANMRAPEYIPLIMEPQSRFYCDPVIVLDFQSLYPSIIIAYNYCFSTCLGRVEHLGESEIFEFGCTQLKVPLKTIQKLENDLNFSPCGIAFVKDTVKKGVLPQMLEEILNTRLMVKKSMKDNKSNKTLQRVLHARQLGLKLIANVTYGYTAANFSGRMPCIEVGDSVVSKGRETLERAIKLVGETSKWGAQVVYGDTDSLFVLVPGRSRKEAFRIGAEIAEAVTNSNPKPVKLKLEKVYQPCILQTKKRYVGYMYESPDQEKPVYDAKGIETVRRDGCPAVAKVLEKSLRLLFETKDLSLVKKYVTRQFSKIVLGRISIQELTFAKEYRGAGGYRPGACVPALELAKQWRSTDPRAEPRVGERVPYVVVAGPPGLPLIRLVRSPSTLLLDPSLKINFEYYITRAIIPPLDRCFSLLGTPVMSWYSELPRKHFMGLPTTIPLGSKKSTISQYFATMNCAVCQKLTSVGICSECQEQPQKLAVALSTKLSSWERRLRQVTKLCQSCCGRSEGIECISLDCPVLYSRNQAQKDMNQADFVRQLQCEFLVY